MNVRPVLLIITLLLSPLAQAGDSHRSRPDDARPPERDLEQDCDETEECIVQGLDLSDEQQHQVRDILQAAGKKQEDLRDDTFHRLQDVLTPEQARKLEQHRADILAYRAKRLRQKARQMEQHARELKESH